MIGKIRSQCFMSAGVCLEIETKKSNLLLCLDSVRWYCQKGNHPKPTLVQEERLHIADMGTQLKPVIQKWRENEEYRRCKECGNIADPQ